MSDDPIQSRRLLLTSEISLHLRLYAEEAIRPAPSRSYLEAHSSRVLKRAAELYADSQAEARPRNAAPAHISEAGVFDARSAQIVDIWCGRKD